MGNFRLSLKDRETVPFRRKHALISVYCARFSGIILEGYSVDVVLRFVGLGHPRRLEPVLRVSNALSMSAVPAALFGTRLTASGPIVDIYGGSRSSKVDHGADRHAIASEFSPTRLRLKRIARLLVRSVARPMFRLPRFVIGVRNRLAWFSPLHRN